MRKVDVTKATSIVTGNSIDRLTLIQCSFKGTVTIATNAGDDILTSVGCNYRAGGILSPGLGENAVTGFDGKI